MVKKDNLLQIIKKKSTIGIFGLGYIGLPRAIQFLNAGFV